MQNGKKESGEEHGTLSRVFGSGRSSGGGEALRVTMPHAAGSIPDDDDPGSIRHTRGSFRLSQIAAAIWHSRLSVGGREKREAEGEGQEGWSNNRLSQTLASPFFVQLFPFFRGQCCVLLSFIGANR